MNRSIVDAVARRALAMTRRVVLVALTVGWSGVARAEPAGDAVALLPLDADRSLEIYGQPIASEIARALVAGKVDVVVVGPRTAVPERARLIIDGTIALGKAGAVTISLRIRNTLDGLVLETLAATAPALVKIDGAAAELSARVLPLIQARLAARTRPGSDASDHGRVIVGAPPKPATSDATVSIAIRDARRPAPGDALASALTAATTEWARAHHRKLLPLDPAKLDGKLADVGELAIGFSIVGYHADAEPGAVPMARARVRVQIAEAGALVFDRVVATDTVLGDNGLAPAALAGRVAREVLAILRPHVRRSVPTWR